MCVHECDAELGLPLAVNKLALAHPVPASAPAKDIVLNIDEVN